MAVFRSKPAVANLALILFVWLAATVGVFAEPPAGPAEANQKQGVPLVVAGEEVYRVFSGLGRFTPEQRVNRTKTVLEKLRKDPLFKVDSIQAVELESSTEILSGETIICSVTNQDAQASGMTRQGLASERVASLRAAMVRDIEQHSVRSLLVASLLTTLSSLVLFSLLWLIGRAFPLLYKKIESSRGTVIRSLRIQQAEFVSADTLTDVLLMVARLVRIGLTLSLLYFSIPLLLSFFPQTRDLAGRIIDLAVGPITNVIVPAFVSYVPNLFFIGVIVFLTYYLVAFIKFLFDSVGRGAIIIGGFDSEWADPTFKIARFLIIAFSLVLIFPYLPGSGSPAFQQVSLFLGILLSLGSSGSVAHIIAGVFLTYTRAFRLGDRVKIADTVGDVVEKTLLATRIETIKHEYITVPNGLVLGSHIINYSSSARNPGVILYTSVTIGYDAPWRTVHRLLIDAASVTEHVLKEPAPFVFQTSLNDFFVTYQLNAHTDMPSRMAEIYSHLHENIQDKFNEAGVEIMSPHFTALRDGNHIAIPENFLPPSYAPRSFRVKYDQRTSDQAST